MNQGPENLHTHKQQIQWKLSAFFHLAGRLLGNSWEHVAGFWQTEEGTRGSWVAGRCAREGWARRQCSWKEDPGWGSPPEWWWRSRERESGWHQRWGRELIFSTGQHWTQMAAPTTDSDQLVRDRASECLPLTRFQGMPMMPSQECFGF